MNHYTNVNDLTDVETADISETVIKNKLIKRNMQEEVLRT